MTRKDYILIANVFRNALTVPNSFVDDLAVDLAYELKKDNQRFDIDHFLAVVRGKKDLQSRPARQR